MAGFYEMKNYEILLFIEPENLDYKLQWLGFIYRNYIGCKQQKMIKSGIYLHIITATIEPYRLTIAVITNQQKTTTQVTKYYQ